MMPIVKALNGFVARVQNDTEKIRDTTQGYLAVLLFYFDRERTMQF